MALAMVVTQPVMAQQMVVLNVPPAVGRRTLNSTDPPPPRLIG
jgi:hypothetical protein